MSPKKTILYLITQTEQGGAQKYVLNLAREIRAEFNVAVAGGEQGADGYLAKELKKINVPFFPLPHLKRDISPLYDFLALREISRLFRRLKPDLVHSNSSKVSILGSLAKIFSSARIIHTPHGWVFNEPLPLLKKMLYLSLEKITAPSKDKIICVAEYDRATALKYKVAPEKKLAVIHNGIETIDFLPKEEARNVLKISPVSDEIIIGSIGNLYTNKGFNYLIEALKILNDSGWPAKALIIGEGEERPELEKLIAQKKLTGKVILAGQIEQASRLLKAFDLYVCSSVKEGLSYTIMEAMAAGLPIIATEVGGNPELIADEETGVLTEAANPKLLALKIKELWEDRAGREKFSARAQIKAREQFSLSATVEKTRRLYRELV